MINEVRANNTELVDVGRSKEGASVDVGRSKEGASVLDRNVSSGSRK